MGVSSLQDSLKEISFVEFDAVLLEEPYKFGMDGFFVVMFFLCFDVTDSLFQERWTDAECAVTFLPCKVLIVFV